MLRDNLSSQAVLFTLVLLLALAYIVWCGYTAWREERAQPQDSDAKATSSDTAAVPDASTATNFQLATIYPNTTFGATSFLIIPLINSASLLLSNWMTERFLGRLLSVISEHHTPHQYASSAHGIPSLKRVTATVSLFVFVAVTVFEVVFLAKIANSIIGANPDGYYGLIVCMIILLVIATALGGQKASIIADRWLLPTAYIGIHLAIASLLLNGKPRDIDAVSAIVFVALVVVVFLRIGAAKRIGGSRSIRHWIIAASTAALLAAMAYSTFDGSVILSAKTLGAIATTFDPSSSGLTWSVFFVALLGAICPAVLYNFVDFSFWQKYSIEIKRYRSLKECEAAVHRPFWLYLVESPLSWLLPVLLGLYAASAFEAAQGSDPVTALFQVIAKQSSFGATLNLLLFASLTAIATSTAASYLAALGDLWKRDIAKVPTGSNGGNLSSGWQYIVGVGIVMILVLVPVDMLAKTTDQLILLLLTSFAPLCALTPLVAWPLFRNVEIRLSPAGKIGVVAAVSSGSIAGVVAGVLGVLGGVGPDTLLFWAPMPIGFVSSWFIYLISVSRFGRSNNR
jgi:hypothetical protein